MYRQGMEEKGSIPSPRPVYSAGEGETAKHARGSRKGGGGELAR